MIEIIPNDNFSSNLTKSRRIVNRVIFHLLVKGNIGDELIDHIADYAKSAIH